MRGDFHRKRVETLRENTNVLQKLIVEDYGRDGDEETGGGGEKRFGNAGRDSAKAGGVCVAEAGKRVDDAPDGAEQAYEWRDGAGGREPGHAFFGAADFFRRGDLHVGGDGADALYLWRLGGARSVAHLALQFAVACGVDGSERGARCGESLRIGDTARGAEDAQEIIAFAADAPEESKLLKNHAPGDDRKQKKNRDDDARNPSGILENASEVDEKDC